MTSRLAGFSLLAESVSGWMSMGITKKVFPPYVMRGGNSAPDSASEEITNLLSEQLNTTNPESTEGQEWTA